MMLANWLLDRLATAAWQVHDFYIYLVSLLYIAVVNPYPLFQIHNFLVRLYNLGEDCKKRL